MRHKKPEGLVERCEAKSTRTLPPLPTHTHMQPAIVFLFKEPEKGTTGLLQQPDKRKELLE